MLKLSHSISKLLLALYLITPSFLAANSTSTDQPSLSYKEIRRYQSEENRSRLEIYLITKGFTPGTKVKMKQKLVDDQVCEPKAILTVLDDGVIGYQGKPLTVPLNNFCVGEPILYTITSLDRQTTATISIVPYPIEKKDDKGHRISIVLADPEATIFEFLAEGFEPSEKLTFTSQSGNERMTHPATASEKGDLFSILMPAVRWEKNGIASIEVTGKDTTLKLRYPWGNACSCRK